MVRWRYSVSNMTMTPEENRLLGEVHANVTSIKEKLDSIVETQCSHSERIGSLERTRSFGKGAVWVIGSVGAVTTGILAFAKKLF
jgi:hypothetical protein